MPNQIVNASGLDGVAGFTGGAGLAADSDVVGAPSRTVITAAGSVMTTAVALAGAAGVYAFGHHSAGPLLVRFATPGGDVDVAVPAMKATAGAPARGIASTFSFSRGWVTAPAGATTWRLRIATTAAALFRPFGSGQASAAFRPCRWAPGPHLNPDLAVATWPERLPNPDPDSLELEPIPLRKAFTGDDGVPTTRRTSNRSRRFCRFGLTLDAAGRDALESFWRANVEEFFFVRPDTGDLCFAEWAEDGDPTDSGGKPGSRSTSVRLTIREA